MRKKTRYKFSHSYLDFYGHKMLVWQATTRANRESRVEQVVCRAEWFWKPGRTPIEIRHSPFRRP